MILVALATKRLCLANNTFFFCFTFSCYYFVLHSSSLLSSSSLLLLLYLYHHHHIIASSTNKQKTEEQFWKQIEAQMYTELATTVGLSGEAGMLKYLLFSAIFSVALAEELYFGSGCYWVRQHDYVELEWLRLVEHARK